MRDDQYISFGMAEKYDLEIWEAKQAESYAHHYGEPKPATVVACYDCGDTNPHTPDNPCPAFVDCEEAEKDAE